MPLRIPHFHRLINLGPPRISPGKRNGTNIPGMTMVGMIPTGPRMAPGKKENENALSDFSRKKIVTMTAIGRAALAPKTGSAIRNDGIDESRLSSSSQKARLSASRPRLTVLCPRR